ncbi:MAG: glycosyltransferase family 39 protein [Candidatus Roizmanbacteria bacterium]|nr:glycosyltransferase family 39 protein [Candidatus Roizmanbacteria bacterium]
MKRVLFLLMLMFCALFLHTYKLHSVPPGFNADEAAYGYNAYSILKTGADEYGNKLPLRLVSFGDYKLPGYSYLTIPFIALFGLNETTTRLPSLIAAILLIPAMYFLAKILFDKKIALVTAFLTTFSPWIHILARHAHEAVPMTLFLVLSLIFLIRLSQKRRLLDGLFFILFLFISLYTYHIARIIAVVYLGTWIYFIKTKNISKKNTTYMFIAMLLLLIPFLSAEIAMPANRIKNLFLFTSDGVRLISQQFMVEQAHSPFSNSLFVGGYEFLRRYTNYFSLNFLTYTGDTNGNRFGFPSMAPLSIVEYMLFILGIVIAYMNIKKRSYILILILMLVAPLSAALTWQENALNRSYFFVVPVLILVSLAVSYIWENKQKIPYVKPLIICSLFGYTILTAYVWNFYFFHYSHRNIVIRSWECGYKELTQVIAKKYNSYDSFHITKENGQPYIFMLFYLNYSPQRYTSSMHTMEKPDVYGYTQITNFDKFIFSTDIKGHITPHTLYVLSQAESQNGDKTDGLKHLQSIMCDTEHMFELYEPITTRTNQTK